MFRFFKTFLFSFFWCCSQICKDINYEALQASDNLYRLLAIVNQLLTTIASQNAQSNAHRENPRSLFRHNDQLEELRNLQDRLREEKTEWQKRREQEERDLADRKNDLELLKAKLRAEQIDIEQQRDELHKKMQILSNQGILSSSNVALSPTSIVCSSSDDAGHQTPHSNIGASCSNLTVDDHTDLGSSNSLSAEHRRKDKWRSASSKYNVLCIQCIFLYLFILLSLSLSLSLCLSFVLLYSLIQFQNSSLYYHYH